MVKTIIKFCLPYGCFYLLQKYRKKKSQQADYAAVVERDKRNTALEQTSTTSTIEITDYDDIVDFFEQTYDIPRQEIIDGSIPAINCETIINQCQQLNQPTIHLLNIGNYLGVALLYIIHRLKKAGIKCYSTIIDPNIPHRGTTDLQTKFFTAAKHFGLLEDMLLLPGYSLAKSLSNDGVSFQSYDPIENYRNEIAPENVLPSLAEKIRINNDVVLFDGNHNSTYLTNEIAVVDTMLSPNGLLVFDDVNDFWSPIKNTVHVFIESNKRRYTQVAYDERILIAQKQR